jgi:predicted nucleotidyltransferase
MKTDLALPIDQIARFCQQWQIIELSLFGSILGDDFHADTDIDILVAFTPTVNRGLLDRANVERTRSSAK